MLFSLLQKKKKNFNHATDTFDKIAIFFLFLNPSCLQEKWKSTFSKNNTLKKCPKMFLKLIFTIKERKLCRIYKEQI